MSPLTYRKSSKSRIYDKLARDHEPNATRTQTRTQTRIPEPRAGRRPIRPGFLYPHLPMLTHLPTLTHVYGYTIDFNTPKIVIFWEKKGGFK